MMAWARVVSDYHIHKTEVSMAVIIAADRSLICIIYVPALETMTCPFIRSRSPRAPVSMRSEFNSQRPPPVLLQRFRRRSFSFTGEVEAVGLAPKSQ
jgi:hypothetical protein